MQKISENREPTVVILGPFTPKAIVTFEDIPISKTARRFLSIRNPADVDFEVSFLALFRYLLAHACIL